MSRPLWGAAGHFAHQVTNKEATPWARHLSSLSDPLGPLMGPPLGGIQDPSEILWTSEGAAHRGLLSCAVTTAPPHKRETKWGPWGCRIHTTWERVRNASSQAPPGPWGLGI